MRALKLVLPALWVLCLAPAAQAATFNANSLADGSDSNIGDGICSTGGGGGCTLRAAVEESSAGAAVDDIVLAPGTHSLAGWVDVVGHNVRIRGAGAGATTIEQTGAGQSVLVLLNTTSEVRDLTLTGGSGPAVGGGLYVSVPGTQSVLLERVLIADNEVSASGHDGYGGGIYKSGAGSLTIRSSTIRGNSVINTDPTASFGAYGGGIAHAGGALEIVNTTVLNNEASELGPSTRSLGGGINSSGGATALRHATVAGNTASGTDARGGNLASNATGHLNVENSIVAYGIALTSGEGCDVSGGGTLSSFGRNIDSGSTCLFGAPNLSNTDPLLLPPGYNGGPTPTLLPAAGSPAIDAAIGCPAPAIDQRGVTRPAGSACDIGAVERVPETTPGGGGGEPRDVVAPIVSDLVISGRRFRTGRATRRTRSLRRSTHFVFHLSEPSLVDFFFERRLAGRRGGGRCQKPARRNRGGRPCVRWLGAGRLAENLPEGRQSVRFTGQVALRGRGRTLSPGSYRVRIEATDRAANHSLPVTGRFRIAR
jgi:hypothetical protein